MLFGIALNVLYQEEVSLNIYSDNGHNFVGVSNEIDKSRNYIENVIHNNPFRSYLLENLINWHFIPPCAPSFGGFWESSVKQKNEITLS